MRRRAGIAAASFALLGAAPGPADPLPPQVQPEASHAASIAPPHAGSAPGARALADAEPFAVLLARTQTPSGPDAWESQPEPGTGAPLPQGRKAGRQQERWEKARSLIARFRGPEALGILQLMQADDPELAYVDSFRLALGAAHAISRQATEAVSTLESPGLAANPEACAWRLLAQDQIGTAVGGAARCAVDAIDARPQAARRPWLLALARNALAAGSASGADAALRGLPDSDPEANLLRGKALLILKDPDQARFRFRRAEKDGSGAVAAAAVLALLQLELSGDKPNPDARKSLDRLLRTWRGDGIEREALKTAHAVAVRANDIPAALHTGQTLIDYHDLGGDAAPLLAALQRMLALLIAPSSGRPLDVAAGLFWDHRALLPPGAEGDRLVQLLAARLEQAGLYRRAAELLRHQMVARAQDVAMGALSVRVATLYLKAGQPETAIAAIRETGRTPYPEAMLTEREQLRAIALAQLGRKDEALALLGAIPASDALRNEILWHAEDWEALAAATAAEGQRKLPLTPERTTLLLRRAIALAVLGREPELQALRAAQAPLFASSPSGAVFLSLTTPGATDPARLTRAMQALPSASPAGALADLLPATLRKAPARKAAQAPSVPAPA